MVNATALRCRNIRPAVLACVIALAGFQPGTSAYATSSDWSPAARFGGKSIVYGSSPDLATNGAGTWLSVYTTTAPGGSGDTEIGFSVSGNGGMTWTTPRILNSDWQDDLTDDSSPAVASDGSIFICTWSRSDGKMYTSRSLNAGQTWTVPQPVTLPDSSHVIGEQPDISSVGDGTWVIVWEEPGNIYCTKSVDDGVHWDDPVFVQGNYNLYGCGTDPCSIHGVSTPRVFSAAGNQTLFVGFTHSWTVPSVFDPVKPGSSYEVSAGHRSTDGGSSFPGNTTNIFIGPVYAGSDEMATDGAGNWMSARRRRNADGYTLTFSQSADNGASFSDYTLPAVEGRAYQWGKVAMDANGHRFRFWAAMEMADGESPATNVFTSSSIDGGLTWSPEQLLDTSNAQGADDPIVFKVEGSATGEFVAVWQANLPDGEPAIWYSINHEWRATTEAEDWHLYD